MKRALYIMVLLVFVVSCRSKKKAVERINEKTKIETHETLNEVKESGVSIDSLAHSTTEKITVKDNSTIELTQADENKTIIITDESGKSLTIKGANAKINTSREATKYKDSSSVQLKKIDTTKKVVNATKDTKIDISKKGRKADSETKGVSTWVWLLLLILLLLGSYFYIKKKTKWNIF